MSVGQHVESKRYAVRALGVKKNYGGVAALKGVDVEIAEGQIFGVIGPNGAGKSTMFDIMCGITKPTEGRVEVLGEDAALLSAHALAQRGVGRTFQRTAVFGEATVKQNLLYGRQSAMRHTVLHSIFGAALFRQEMHEFEVRADAVLSICGLQAVRDHRADALSYGVQRRLAVAIMLMLDPKIIFLDEPVAGMNDIETAEFVDLVREIAPGRTVVVVEHDMAAIGALCDRALVMVDGLRLVEDSPANLFQHPEVISAYLGVDDDRSLAD